MTVKHFSPHQVAERWNISEGTLERGRMQGNGPVYLRLPGRVVYRLEDIEAFERKALHRSTSERVQPGTFLPPGANR